MGNSEFYDKLAGGPKNMKICITTPLAFGFIHRGYIFKFKILHLFSIYYSTWDPAHPTSCLVKICCPFFIFILLPIQLIIDTS